MATKPQEQGESGWVEVVLGDDDPIPRAGEATPDAFAERDALKAYMEREFEARKRWAKLPTAEQRDEAARRFKAQEERDWRLAQARGRAFDRLPLARAPVRTRYLSQGPRRLDRRLGCGRPRAAGRSSSRVTRAGPDDGDGDPEPAGGGDPAGVTSRTASGRSRHFLEGRWGA
jgi:hypothetical protein